MDEKNVAHSKGTLAVFCAGLLLVVGVLGWFVTTQETIVSSDTKIFLKTMPVDPRDMLRGDYVTLRYEIQNDPLVVAVAEALGDNMSVHIYLTTDSDGIARVQRASAFIENPPSGVHLVATVQGGQATLPDLARFYVPEGTGYVAESLRGDLLVEVALHEGQARALGLYTTTFTPLVLEKDPLR